MGNRGQLGQNQLERMIMIAQQLGLVVPDGSTLLGAHIVVCEELWSRLERAGFGAGTTMPIADERNSRTMFVIGRQNTTNADIRDGDGASGSISIIYLAYCALPELKGILAIWVEN